MHVFELTDGWDLSQGNPAPFSSHWKAAHAPHWEWRILRHWEWRTLCCIIAPLNPLKIENSLLVNPARVPAIKGVADRDLW